MAKLSILICRPEWASQNFFTLSCSVKLFLNFPFIVFREFFIFFIYFIDIILSSVWLNGAIFRFLQRYLGLGLSFGSASPRQRCITLVFAWCIQGHWSCWKVNPVWGPELLESGLGPVSIPTSSKRSIEASHRFYHISLPLSSLRLTVSSV